MRVQIISDGTPTNTKVIDLDTGNEIIVSGIDFHIEFGKGWAECKLILPPILDLQVELDAELTEG